MAGEHRTTINTVDQTLATLSERIRACDFIAAVRQMECAHPEKPRVGEAVHVQGDIVRLSQNVALGFQGTALHSLESSRGASDYRLHVNFLGLLGSNGPMPLHFTEYADQRTRHHADPTFKEFLDLFNHRLISLFYRASVQFDPVISFDRSDENSYTEFLGALCGLLPEASNHRDAIADSVKRHYPGWFGNSCKSPDGIVALLSDYFDLPVKVREWVGDWLPLPQESLIRLGSGEPSVRLGRSMYVGRRVWSTRHKFRIQLGPLDWETFASFKPGGLRARTLHDLVRNYVGDEWDWDLELKLLPGDVRALALNRKCSLGFDSWARSTVGRRLSTQSVMLNKNLIGRHVH